jgi:hypothetical protein
MIWTIHNAFAVYSAFLLVFTNSRKALQKSFAVYDEASKIYDVITVQVTDPLKLQSDC